jgi:hypothetical protein
MRWSEEFNMFNSPIMKTSFISSKDDFVNNPRRGLSFLKSNVMPFLGGGEAILSEEIMFQHHEILDKFRGSKLLIAGAGPSTESAEFSEEDYDFVWSCNHFYKNEKIKKMNVSLTTIGDEVNVRDESLLSYLENNNTIICFENRNRDHAGMAFIKEKFPDRTFWALTRYHSRIGTIPRIACIAICLGVSEIHFVGMDGYVPKKLLGQFNNTCFEANKRASGYIEEHADDEGIVELYKEQYLTFWDYMLHDVGKHVIFKNLGAGHPCNLSDVVLKEKIGEDYGEYLLNRGSSL